MERVCMRRQLNQEHHDLKADRGGTVWDVLGLSKKVVPPAGGVFKY